MNRTGAKILGQALALVLLGSVAAAIHASLRPVSLPLPARTGGDGADGQNEQGLPPITLEEALALHESGAGAFIDARSLDEYEAGHVPGAFPLTMDDFSSGRPPRIVQDLSEDTPIVVYCEGGDCHISGQVAQMLILQGFADVRILREGWPGWDEAGYPEETGPPPYDSH